MPGPAPGTYAFSDWVGLECLRLLENMLMMAGGCNFGYQDEFKKNFAVGDTVSVKMPQEFLVQNSFGWNPQGINRQTTTITVDNPASIQFAWDSIEEALKLERSKPEISKQYIHPAMAQMSQYMESKFMDFAFYNTPNVVGTLASAPTTWDVYAQANTILVENAASEGLGMDMLGISPYMHEQFIANTQTQFNPTDAISSNYKKGFVGRIPAAGWDWYRTMSFHAHTTGVWTTVATGVTINAAGQSGSSITVACTTGDTFKRGDKISIGTTATNTVFNVNPRTRTSTGRSKYFTITADAVGASSVATLSIYPAIVGPGSPYQNVSQLPPNSAIVTLWPGTTMVDATAKTGITGLGFNKLAFAMAGVELPMPNKGGTVFEAVQKKDPNTGLSMALICGMDPINGRFSYNRLDSLFGFGRLYADKAACVIASSR